MYIPFLIRIDCKYTIVSSSAKKCLGWRVTSKDNDDWVVYWTDGMVTTDFLAKMKYY